MSDSTVTDAPEESGTSAFTVIVYIAQFFFGGWFLYNGLNYWIEFFPQPPGTSAIGYQLISALIASGLFAVVKGLEIVVGIMLLANRFVPLAIVMAFTISVTIAHHNLVNVQDALGIVTGVVIMSLNGIMAIGHLDKFLPMLVYNQGDPSARGLKMLFGKR